MFGRSTITLGIGILVVFILCYVYSLVNIDSGVLLCLLKFFRCAVVGASIII